MIDYRGARGSNAGDDYHELWVARQAIRLLSNEDGLQAIAVEGLAGRDENDSPQGAWDGVDCTLYFGGRNVFEATRIELVQLKYSSAAPASRWTVSRLIGRRVDQSIVRRLANAWKSLIEQRASIEVEVVLVSNQPVQPDVRTAVRRAAESALAIPTRKPTATERPEVRLAFASGLKSNEFVKFASSLRFKGEKGSRLAIEGSLLRAIAQWTGPSIRQPETRFRQFIRRSMMPEAAGETITREDVRLHLVGASSEYDLFPCPSQIDHIEQPVSRDDVRQAIRDIKTGVQHVCLHGGAGTGKTTALHEIEACLSQTSVMVVYDCYGNGRYLDSSALRHRPRDAFIQLTNELATKLRLPLFLEAGAQSDYPRLFAERLRKAAETLAAHDRDALIVIAVDSADNAVLAGGARDERHFVKDFLMIGDLPPNARFVVTSRNGRLDELQLPKRYRRIQISPFVRDETAEHVLRRLNVSNAWVDDFHHLSNGIPRVQAYALAASATVSDRVLDRLKPEGKLLEDIFRTQFDEAVGKAGSNLLVEKLCAGLIALPRPVPLRYLAEILGEAPDVVADICSDLAPGLRLNDGAVSLADEDLETFVRSEATETIAETQSLVADLLLNSRDSDPYAALNIAGALVLAGRREDLLRLVEEEPAPAIVADVALRREAEAQRLRSAIKACRTAGNAPRALRFVLMGAEGVNTAKVLSELLLEHADLAARFTTETVSRLVLSDATRVGDHGRFLFHGLSADADRHDAISYREGLRSLQAWLGARETERAAGSIRPNQWRITASEACSAVEATLSSKDRQQPSGTPPHGALGRFDTRSRRPCQAV